MHTGVIQCITRTLEVEQEVILKIEESTDILHEVIKDTNITTIIIEETVTGVKVMIEIEVDH